MNVELENLTPEARQLVEERARQTGRPLEEILSELVQKALEDETGRVGAEKDDVTLVHQQKEALSRLHHRLDSLAVEGEQDGFSGRDHDDVLYGWKK